MPAWCRILEAMITTETMLENARLLFADRWNDLLVLRKKVLQNCEHEDIHDLRVASRRFRAALDLFQPLSGNAAMGLVEKEVRRLTKALGKLRNLDEAMAFWGARLAGREQLAPLLGRFEECREQERQEVVRRLQKFSPKKLALPVAAAMSGLGRINRRTPLFQIYLADASLNRFNAVVSWLPVAVDLAKRTERHNLRISIKKWRYLLEIVAGVSGRKHDDVLELLKKYQTLLGSMNDLAMFGVMNREMLIVWEEMDNILMSEEQALFESFLALAGAEPLRYVFRL